MRASSPPCRRTPVSTIKQRYLINCPASRPAGPSRTPRDYGKPASPTRVFQRWGVAMATRPEDPKTRNLCSHSEAWRCVFRAREMQGGRVYYTVFKSTSFCDNLAEKVHTVTHLSTIQHNKNLMFFSSWLTYYHFIFYTCIPV